MFKVTRVNEVLDLSSDFTAGAGLAPGKYFVLSALEVFAGPYSAVSCYAVLDGGKIKRLWIGG